MINISIVIPILNEAKNIKLLIPKIDKEKKKLGLKKFEILIIDDNSEDNIKKVFINLKKKFKYVKLYIRKAKNKDLSKSCVFGFNKCSYNNILVMDGDLQHNPSNINKLIEVYVAENADIVVGSRNLFNKKNEGLGLIRLTSSKFLILLISLLLNKKTDDPMSGFFIFKKKIYELNKNKLFAKGYKILFDLIYASNEKLKIIDVDINFRKRSEGSSKMGFKIIFILILLIIKKIFIRK